MPRPPSGRPPAGRKSGSSKSTGPGAGNSRHGRPAAGRGPKADAGQETRPERREERSFGAKPARSRQDERPRNERPRSERPRDDRPRDDQARDNRPRRESTRWQDRSAFRPDRPAKERRTSTLRPAASRKVAEGAIALLDAISASREPADRVRHKWMRDHHRGYDEAEREALIHLSEDVLRLRGRIDWWLTQGKTALPPDNRLRLAAYRILQGGAKADGLLPLFGDDDAVEALLRRLEGHTLEHPDMQPAARYSIPDWILPLFKQRFGADLDLELAAMLRPAPLDVRVNTLKTTRQAAAAALQAEGQQSQSTPFSPLGLRLSPRAYVNNTQVYADGLIEPQDEGSQLAAQLVDAAGAKMVMDFCAGAGGKTLVLAAAMKNAGRLVAMDVNMGRLSQAKLRLRRAGVHNAETRELDAKWLKRQAGKADRVLVDAPCTGTGTWRRKPDAKWRIAPRDLEELVPRQAEILDRAAKLLHPGGRLVYVTCSVLKQENEEQIDAFLKRHPDFKILPVVDLWAKAIGGACPVPGPYLSLSPGRHGTDGFFAAVLLRDA